MKKYFVLFLTCLFFSLYSPIFATQIGYQIDCAPASQEFKGLPMIGMRKPTKFKNFIVQSTSVNHSNFPPGTYWLGSNTIMQDNFAPDGEIVTIKRWSNNTAYLESNISRTWHGPAVLVKVKILKNIVIDGPYISIDGVAQPKDDGGQIKVCLSENVSIRNRIVNKYKGIGISVQGCKNVTINNNEVSYPESTVPGNGYGIQGQRCVNVLMNLNSGNFNRHLITIFASQNVQVNNCSATNSTISAFDCHGFGEEDVMFFNNDGGASDFPIGNRFLWGSKNITVTNHIGGKSVIIYGNTDNILIQNSSWSGNGFLYTNEAGRPGKITFMHCSVKGFFEDGSISSSGFRFFGNGGCRELRLIDCISDDVADSSARGIYIPSVDFPTEIFIKGGTWGNPKGDYSLEINHSGSGKLILRVDNWPTFKFARKALRVSGVGKTYVDGIAPANIEGPLSEPLMPYSQEGDNG